MENYKDIDYNKLNEEEQIKLIFLNPNHIRFINYPTTRVQEMAVRTDPCSIQYIKEPNEYIQMSAVRKDVFAISYIEKPTIDVEKLAIYNFDYIKNPSEEIKWLAVRKGVPIYHIKNLTTKMLSESLKVDCWNNLYINGRDLTESIQPPIYVGDYCVKHNIRM